MKKFAYIIRVITVAPIMALVMLLVLFFRDPQLYGSPLHFVFGVLFLVVLPLLAYPLQPLIKKYKDKGREGQRALAIIFAVAGYILGCVSALVLGAPSGVLIIFLSYLFSGLLVFLCTKLLHFRASGHACGVTGPFLLLVYFGQLIGYIGIPVLLVSWLSSVYMKRHTHPQLLVGALIPFAALGLVLLLMLAV